MVQQNLPVSSPSAPMYSQMPPHCLESDNRVCRLFRHSHYRTSYRRAVYEKLTQCWGRCYSHSLRTRSALDEMRVSDTTLNPFLHVPFIAGTTLY